MKVSRLSPEEGQRLQRIVRRGESKPGGNEVRWRRAMILQASTDGNTVPVIARLVAESGDIVREVIHRFNDVGLDCRDPHWAGGRPRLLSADEKEYVAQTALMRPQKLRQPFTRWSVRELDGYVR